MNKFNFKDPIFIITILILIIVLIFNMRFLLPRFQEIGTTRAGIGVKREAIEKRDVSLRSIKENKERLKEYQEQLDIISSALPNDAELNIPYLFGFIQTTTARAGLVLTEIGPFTISPVEAKPGIQRTQFSFEVIGSYPSLKSLLRALENSARIIQVNGISFSAPERGQLFTFDLRISVYNSEKALVPLTETVNINFQVLEHPALKRLEPLPLIELEEMGRENPFIPF